MTSFFSSSYCHLGKNLLGFALAASASIAIARHGGMRTPTQLIVATRVAIIVVVTFLPALVVVCAQFLMRLVARVGTALFV